ncbi:hypothetical protein D7B24_007617 [Verticillium nonalfalfae]|uniref:Zn(2)-C6 fungal-type domain-containing protein n=1 Tax=Verticillium nonalfalfae TaxID=1051616 RepID=A0A3M9Y6V5_9PEZI|nr:uncharacterized protein D7B24_007617 [Verticillium nonalfalfae]RNJ56233.1 hypothetical protein D7B24_007617 [Verticillium nonalfalfae]
MAESNTTIPQEAQQSRYNTATDIKTNDHEAFHIPPLPSSVEEGLELPVPPPDADDRTPAATENAPDDAGLAEDEVVTTTKKSKASGRNQPAKAQETPKDKKPCAKTESARAKYDRIVALECLAKRKCANCAKKRRGCDCYIDPERLNSACAKCTLHKEGCSFVQDAAEPLGPDGIVNALAAQELPSRRAPAGREEAAETPVRNAVGVAPSDSVPEEVQERIEQELARYQSAPVEQKPAAIMAPESRLDASRDEKSGLKRTPLPSSRPKPVTTSGVGAKRKPLPDGRPQSSSKSTDDSKPEPTEDGDPVPKRETSPAKRRKLESAASQTTGENGDSVEDMKS